MKRTRKTQQRSVSCAIAQVLRDVAGADVLFDPYGPEEQARWERANAALQRLAQVYEQTLARKAMT